MSPIDVPPPAKLRDVPRPLRTTAGSQVSYSTHERVRDSLLASEYNGMGASGYIPGRPGVDHSRRPQAQFPAVTQPGGQGCGGRVRATHDPSVVPAICVDRLQGRSSGGDVPERRIPNTKIARARGPVENSSTGHLGAGSPTRGPPRSEVVLPGGSEYWHGSVAYYSGGGPMWDT